ncbi:MAG: hypothetical protein ABFS46_18395 [Myxococcota bacterium]
MRRRLGRWAILLAPALLLSAPRAAEACSVCSAASSDSVRDAFLVTTVFLSVLPLLLVGGFAWWLRRRTRELQAAPERASQPTYS